MFGQQSRIFNFMNSGVSPKHVVLTLPPRVNNLKDIETKGQPTTPLPPLPAAVPIKLAAPPSGSAAIFLCIASRDGITTDDL